MTAKKFVLRPANIAYMDADCLDPKALAILHDSFDPVWHDGEWESILTDEQIQEAIDNTESVEYLLVKRRIIVIFILKKRL